MTPAVAVLKDAGFAILTGVIPEATLAALIESMAHLGARHGLRNLLRASPNVAVLAADLKRVVAPVLGSGAFPVRGIFFDKLPLP